MRRLFDLLIFIIPLVIILALISFVFNARLLEDETYLPIEENTTVTKPKQSGNYAYYLSIINNLGQVKLIHNKPEQDISNLVSKLKCQVAINGGFYNVDRQPLGYLLVDGIEISSSRKSPLMNGFVWLSKQGGLGITQELPLAELEFALQNGPLIILSGQPLEFEIQNDKRSRRSVIGTLSNGNLVFLIVFDPSSLFHGPHLQELPSVVNTIARDNKLIIIDALNLDGGSASFYKDRKVELWPFKEVNNFFCVKN